MNWKLKALVQQLLSRVPFGENMNYYAQKHITRNLPLGKDAFLDKVESARRNFDAFTRYGPATPPYDKAVFYEFGAGWDMIIPLSYHLLGIRHQLLIDIRPLLRLELINDSISKFNAYQADIQAILSNSPDAGAYLSKRDIREQIKARFGIEYRAPCDARDTQIDSSSIDFISSTATLEHSPARDILPILKECRRILRDGGIMTCYIGYYDHYSYFDRSITPYNFYRYSRSAWSFYNPALHYQNRLRHRDFAQLIQDAGFSLIEDVPTPPTAADIRALETVMLYDDFRKDYQAADLAVQSGFFVLKK
jgi:SAM-dependent methyltransferase